MDLLINVLRSPMSFFECTPSGNLLNRFAKEIDAIDCMVPDGLKMMLSYVFKLMEVCIIVLIAMPFAAVIILPLAFPSSRYTPPPSSRYDFDPYFFFEILNVDHQELGSITVCYWNSSEFQNQPLLILPFTLYFVPPPADIDVTCIHYELWESPQRSPLGFTH